MKINHNISAAIAANSLSVTENRLSKSLERLTSGLKINRAADDAAGMAISQKMDTQIRGLSRASQNALDGISVVETAEGALSEVGEMLQRMRELAVQAANETNSEEDREAIQAETDALATEINRISKDTEFNKAALLDGSLDQKAYTDNNLIKVSTFSDEVAVGKYGILVAAKAEKAVLAGEGMDPAATGALDGDGLITAEAAGTVTVNGISIEIAEGDSAERVREKLRDGCEIAGVKLLSVDAAAIPAAAGDEDNGGYAEAETAFAFSPDLKLAFVSEDFGSSERVGIACGNTALSDLLGISSLNNKTDYGKDAEVSLGDGFGSSATASAKGNEVTVTDRNGFSMEIRLAAGSGNGEAAVIDVMDVGTLTLQIGANEKQTMEIKIPEISAETLGVGRLNYISTEGAENAITSLDGAIQKVSAVRAKLGAYQNRLEHASASLEVSEQNMTEALSRIEDVDMAEEMATYTQLNILSQAGTSMLAQANDRPQTVLQLLQ